MDRYTYVLGQSLKRIDEEPESVKERTRRKLSLISRFPLPRETEALAAFTQGCLEAAHRPVSLFDSHGRHFRKAWNRKASASITVLRHRRDTVSIQNANRLSAGLPFSERLFSIGPLVLFVFGSLCLLMIVAVIGIGLVVEVSDGNDTVYRPISSAQSPSEKLIRV
ncbi:MAG: hypothetical protein WCT14_12820 [Treponemataceae bacterium]